MKIGVKCEIHSCTIEFTKKFLKKYFSSEEFELIDKAFSARIDSQYYINKKIPDKNYNTIIKKTPIFIVKCKNIIIEEEEINKIRTELIAHKKL